MKTHDFTQETISHNLKDPHSKALEFDRLSPHIAITTQSLAKGGRGTQEHEALATIDNIVGPVMINRVPC